jgi:hypothetical protein
VDHDAEIVKTPLVQGLSIAKKKIGVIGVICGCFSKEKDNDEEDLIRNDDNVGVHGFRFWNGQT